MARPDFGPARVRPRARREALALVLLAAVAFAAPPVAHARYTPPPAARQGYVYVVRWTTLPDQDLLSGSAYTAWCRKAIPRCFRVPGISGLTTYRAAAGEPHIVTLFGFQTLGAFAGWRGSRDIEALTEQSHRFTYETETELWGPSPYAVPAPARARRDAGANGHVVYVFAWNVFPGKGDDYPRWIEAALRTWSAGPGIESITGHRVLVGTRTDVFACEFPDFASWAAWYGSAEIQRTRAESREFVLDTRTELWGPNPLIPPMEAPRGAAGVPARP